MENLEQQSQKEFRSFGNGEGNSDYQKNKNNRNVLVLAGAILSLIGAILVVIIGFWFSSILIGFLIFALAVTEIVLTSITISKNPRGVTITAGIFGLFFGGLIGGILLLIGINKKND